MFPKHLWLLLAASVALASPALAGDLRYSITDLGTFGGSNSAGYGINNSMQVVGWASTTSETIHAFLWQNGSMSDLGVLPGGSKSAAWDINSKGEIAGWSSVTQGYDHAISYSNGVMYDLGTLGGRASAACSISDNSLISGWSTELYTNGDDTMPQAIMVKNGVLCDISTFLDWYDSTGFDVNDSTQLVGVSFLWHPYFATSAWHPFLWYDSNGNGTNERSELIDLLTLGTHGVVGTAYAINSAGQIAGGADVVSDPVRIKHAFLITPVDGVWVTDTNTDYVNDLMQDLGTLGGNFAEARDINENGWIVGYSTLTNGTTCNAFLWKDGVMTNLNDLIPTNTGWLLTDARAINDAGEIVGFGTISGKTHGFLLSLPIRIYRMPSYGTYDEVVETNELSEVVTSRFQIVSGFELHWSSGWDGKDTASVYTVEARDPRGTNDWAVITPTSQWPVLGLNWTNALDGSLRGQVFRVRATSWPGP